MSIAKEKNHKRTIGVCRCGRQAVRIKQNFAICQICDEREKRGRSMRRNPGAGRR